MKEKVIEVDTAKLAKEKGFDIPTPYYYHPQYGLHTSFFSYENSNNENYNSKEWAPGYYSAPTQSLLQKWLRDEWDTHIKIDFCVITGEDRSWWSYRLYNISTCTPHPVTCEEFEYKSYEEALEAGLLEILETVL